MTALHPVLNIDFETFSLIDLKRTGVKTYSRHPSTRVLCLSFSFDGGKTVYSWRDGQVFPVAVMLHVINGGIVRGWNVSFEWHIWNNTLTRQLGWKNSDLILDLSQLEDTMARAAYWGLPLSLDQAGPAAGVNVHKDKDGHSLMLRMCRPRTVDYVQGTMTTWHETDPAKFDRLVAYCENDVRTEAAIAAAIPSLPQQERVYWALDQKINDRGVGLDTKFVLALRQLALEAAGRANVTMQALTGGRVLSVTSTAALLAYLKDKTSYPHDNLRKDVVAERLDDPSCRGLERDLLELRADNAKTSAAKLSAMLDACTERDRIGSVFGMLQYYGASRTGRWAGRLIQMQNLPRGAVKAIDQAIKLIDAGATIDQIEALFGPAMTVVTSALRSCIVARPGKLLVSADFSQIEARVLPWLSGQDDILQVFASGRDVYRYTAAKVKKVPYDQISKDSPLRQMGKVMVLGLGFGMSGPKFVDAAAGYGITLTLDEAKEAVAGWRAANDKTVDFWWQCDAAARHALLNPALQFPAGEGKVLFGMFGKHLCIRLPSGRHLVYRDAALQPSKDRPGQMEITYLGIDQYTRKWTRLRTYGGKLVENIVQAVARDIMAAALLRCESVGMSPVLTVHDELILEEPADTADAALGTVLTFMKDPPAWAAGLPLDAEGWVGPRYKK